MQNAMCIETIDLGLRPYKEVWDLQHTIFNKMVAQKRQGNKPQKEYLLLVEHTPVITLGKHAKKSNLLIPASIMDREGIDCFHIERGGMSHITAPDNLWHIRYLTLKATGWE